MMMMMMMIMIMMIIIIIIIIIKRTSLYGRSRDLLEVTMGRRSTA